MARYPLFGVDQVGKSTNITAQHRINMYAEVRREEDRTRMSFHQRPGLELFAALGNTPIRGMRVVGDNIYAVHRGTLYSINNAGVATSEGTLNTATGRVDMADNGTELMIVDGTNGYIYETGDDTFNEIVDADFPDTVNTVTYQAGRFIYDQEGSGQFGISASYDGMTYDATEIATAESFPDDVVRVFVDQGELMVFGSESMEIWANVGAVDFPYAPIAGAVVEWGLAARWSVARFNNTICWLGANRMGEAQVVQLNGYVPRVISNPELEYLINNYSSVSDASALSYMSGGHPFYQLNFPIAKKTWCYDGSTGLWSELQYSTLGARHRAEIGVQFLNKTIVSDYSNGNLYTLKADTLADNGADFAKELTGKHIFNEETISIGRLWLDLDEGVGGLVTDPQAMLSISKDGGKTYGPEHWTSIGKEGAYNTRAIWRRLGRSREWLMKVRVTDPVKLAISGAWVE